MNAWAVPRLPSCACAISPIISAGSRGRSGSSRATGSRSNQDWLIGEDKGANACAADEPPRLEDDVKAAKPELEGEKQPDFFPETGLPAPKTGHEAANRLWIEQRGASGRPEKHVIELPSHGS